MSTNNFDPDFKYIDQDLFGKEIQTIMDNAIQNNQKQVAATVSALVSPDASEVMAKQNFTCGACKFIPVGVVKQCKCD